MSRCYQDHREDCNASLNAFNAIVRRRPIKSVVSMRKVGRREEMEGREGGGDGSYRSHFWVTDWMTQRKGKKRRKRD